MPEPTVRRTDAALAPAARGRLRVLRGGVLGALSLALATGAHALAGGRLPGVGALAVTAVVLALVAAVLTARRCGFRLLLPVLALEQLALHLFFGLAGSAAACAVGGDAMAHGHATTVTVGGCGSGGMAGGMADGMTMAPGAATPMLVAHVAATVLTAWLLARGDAWLWRAVERVAVAAGLGTTGRRSTRRPVPRRARRLRRPSRLVSPRAAPRGPPVTA